MSFISTLALLLAVALCPWAVVRHVAPRANASLSLALWGPVLIALNILVPIGLHLTGVPISRLSLSATHLILAGGLIGLTLFRRLPLIPESRNSVIRLAFALLVFMGMTLPFTHIAGIDTYKWQDLASAVQVEHSIPWLVHPASLLGFTPRSYPSAQPLLLATIQILGGTGVDWGFYIFSVLAGAMGLMGAYALGRRLLDADAPAFWFAILYVFSPVFMRYNYWATGRGLLMGLLPLFLLSLLSLPRWRAVAGCLVMLPLLAMAHKAGSVAAIIIPILFALSPLLALLRTRWVPVILVLGAFAAGFLLGGQGGVSVPFRLLNRLSILSPLSLAGWVGASLLPGSTRELPAWLTKPAWRAMLTGGLATVPLVFTDDMYGTLIALPFVAFAGTVGLQWIINSFSASRTPVILAATAVLTFIPAIVIVAHQASDSPSESVYQAAQFLERHDPSGPFRIEAPGRARTQIQAYVSGCPRFNVYTTDASRLVAHWPPPRSGNWHRDIGQWVHYLRGSLDLTGSSTDWYGDTDRVYHVTIAGEGTAPNDQPLIFQSGNVAVFGPSPK